MQQISEGNVNKISDDERLEFGRFFFWGPEIPDKQKIGHS